MFCWKCGKEIDDDSVFCVHCGTQITQNNDNIKNTDIEKNNQKIHKNNTSSNGCLIGCTIGCFIIALIFLFIIFMIAVFSDSLTSLNDPKNIKCVIHKNLCIATTDIDYDYTSVKTRTSGYPTYNKEWNNGWASAQNACKAWGGRLPSMEEFAVIVDAFNQNKIRLEDYKTYLSSTQINTYRIYAYSHYNDYARKGYNSKSIYDSAISIAKSADHNITGNYSTSTAYTWNARCVKDVK